jgi:mannose-1-phosphate guanylyltransferase/phosphomannomutase
MKKAVIMAGGFGTRLRPLTMTIPKPMVPILNTPMVEHIVNLLKKHNIKDILSVLYFNPESITSYFEDGSKFGVEMKYVLAQADYGTAGAVRNAAEHIDDRFIIISGDVLTDFDLTKALEFHIEKGSKATLLLTRVTKPLQYGIVMTDDDGKITRFLEKPSWGEVFSDTINTGIYILERDVLDLIPFQEEFDFSKDLFPLMLKNDMPLYGYIADGYWRDIGNLEEYRFGQLDAITGEVEINKKGIEKDNQFVDEHTRLAPTAKLSGSNIIGHNSSVGDHTLLHNCVIGRNCSIGNGVRLSGVTLWDNCSIGDFAEITDAVLCNDCKVGISARIMENVYISVGCTIEDNATILPNLKLWPMKHVESGSVLATSLVQEGKWLKELFTDARISGISNIEINPEFGAKLGAAIGMAFGQNSTLVVSRDPDQVSRFMKRAIGAGLSSVGVKINDLQTTSIPQTRQELRTGKIQGGLHIRKSPRDPEMTDIIIFNKDGRDISLSQTKSIERFFFGEDIKRAHYNKVGTIAFPERTNEIYIHRYMQSLKTEVIQERKFKILIDYSYGLASSTFPYILGKLNVQALSLHDYVDATKFKPDPTTISQTGDEAAKIMRSLGYELGFMMETGAEKISLIDERGVWYSPMRLLTIVTKLFLETHKNREPYKIAVSINASTEIDIIAKEYNVEVIRIKNSHSAMMDATLDESVLFVGGAWGGYIFTEFLFASDGMFSVGQILEMLAQTNMKISQLDEMLPRRYQYSVSVNCPWEFKGTVMRKAMEYSTNQERQLVEGVKIFLGDDSVLITPDKEKPAFWVIGESKQYDQAVTLAKKISGLVTHWQDND